MQRFNQDVPATNLSDVLAGIWRRRLLIFAVPLLGLIAGELFLITSKPKFLSEAQVLIENQATPFDRSNSVPDQGNADALVNDKMVLSQVSVMKSRDIASRVVDQLNLETKHEYNAKLGTSGLLGKIAIAVGFKDDPQLYSAKDSATNSLLAGVTIYPVPETNVIGIKSLSSDAGLAAATANAIAKTYVLSTHEIGANSNDRVRSWMSQQIDDLRAKVTASDNAVEKYRTDAGLLKGTSATLGTQQISELNSQITVVETARAEAQAKFDQIKNLLTTRGTVDASADVLASTMVQNLRNQQVAAQRKVSELSATYLPNHPKMIAAQKELTSVNAQVRDEAMRVAESLQGQARVADQRAAALHADLDKQKGSQSVANASDVKLQALQREADANRNLLQTMLNRYADANARQDASQQPGFARVIQIASVSPSIYFPKTGPIIMLSTIAGLAIGLGLAFILELLKAPLPAAPRVESATRRHAIESGGAETVKIPDIDVGHLDAAFKSQTAQDAPKPQPQSATILGAMPGSGTFGGLEALFAQSQQGKGNRLSGAARHLANLLLNLKSKHGYAAHSFATVGSVAPNGALAALATARELSARAEKVIVLELSPQPKGIEVLAALGSGPGLTELVSGQADFTKVVTRAATSNVHFIRLGQQPTAENMQKLASRLPQILDALRTIYGHIILHSGEVSTATVNFLAAGDTSVILAPPSRMADATAAASCGRTVPTSKTGGRPSTRRRGTRR